MMSNSDKLTFDVGGSDISELSKEKTAVLFPVRRLNISAAAAPNRAAALTEP